MSNEKFVDLLFAGAAVVPAGLALTDHLDVAFMLFCPLLIAACLTAAYLEGTPANAEGRVR